MSDEKIKVISYSGYRGEECPRTLIVSNKEVKVLEILDMRIEEDRESKARRRFFKVKGSDGFRYEIYYDEKSKEWFLTY
jgi:hypothetical protein